jgi:hypothetical protein
MPGVHARTVAACVIHGVALGDLLACGLLVHPTVRVDSSIANFLQPVALAPGSRPFDALIGLQIEEFHLGTIDRFGHTDIVSREYSLYMVIQTSYRSFVAGDDITITIELPYDLTGYTASSKMESNLSMTVATFDYEMSGTTLTLTLDAATSLGIAAGKYLWDAKVVDPLGRTETVARGTVEILETT